MARVFGAALAAAFVGAALGGCSDLYFARRDPIALSAGDAVAANSALQVVDPWPAHSGNTNIAFNGERMQRAVECYRANRVTEPADLGLSTSSTQAIGLQPTTSATNCQGPMISGGVQPASGAPTNAASTK